MDGGKLVSNSDACVLLVYKCCWGTTSTEQLDVGCATCLTANRLVVALVLRLFARACICLCPLRRHGRNALVICVSWRLGLPHFEHCIVLNASTRDPSMPGGSSGVRESVGQHLYDVEKTNKDTTK